jgi:hypothetical protein
MNRAVAMVLALVSSLFFSSVYAYNDMEISMEVGTGIRTTENANLYLLGFTFPAKPILDIKSYVQYNAGGWDGDRKSSIVGIARGLQWDNKHTRVRLSTGGSLLSDTSDRLSTNFQFYEQFMVEYRSKQTSVALSYRHWSNAYMKLPNYGMDFFGLQVETKF